MNTQVMPTGYGPRFPRTPEVYPDEGTGMSSIGYGAMMAGAKGGTFPGMGMGGGQAAPQGFPGQDPADAPPPILPPTHSNFQLDHAEQNFRGNALQFQQEPLNHVNYLRSLPPSRDPQVNAIRQSMIADYQAQAKGRAPDFQRNNNFLDDANNRANAYNGGQVGLMGSQANENNARANQTNFLTPHQGGLIDSQANENNARAAIYPNQGNLLDSQAGLANAQADQTRAMYPGMVQSQGIQNDLSRQLIPPTIQSAVGTAQQAGPMAQAQVNALISGTASIPQYMKRIQELEARNLSQEKALNSRGQNPFSAPKMGITSAKVKEYLANNGGDASAAAKAAEADGYDVNNGVIDSPQGTAVGANPTIPSGAVAAPTGSVSPNPQGSYVRRSSGAQMR